MNEPRIITEYGYPPKPSRRKRAKNRILRLVGRGPTTPTEQKAAINDFIDMARSTLSPEHAIECVSYFEYTDKSGQP